MAAVEFLSGYSDSSHSNSKFSNGKIYDGQGGFLCFETTALSMLVQCFASYHHRLASSLSILLPTSKGEGKAEYHNDHVTEEHAQHTPVTSQPTKWGVLEAFSIDVSQFSLDLVIENESGKLTSFFTCFNYFHV